MTNWGIKPKVVDGINNEAYFYYQRMLYLKLFSLFKIENAPENWDNQYLFENLFRNGVIAVTDTELGVIPLNCGVSGVNVYNKPTDIIIANPVLGSFNRKIGVDGVIVYLARLQDTFYTVNELVRRYSVMLAQIDGSFNTTLINSRVAMLFECSSTAELKTMQKIYDDVSSGKPAVFKMKPETGVTNSVTFNNVKQTFIGKELLDVKRSLYREFLTEIGVNNANNDKRERLNTDEVNSNNKELLVNIKIWETQLKQCFKQVNEMFNLNVEIMINDDVIGGEFNETEDI